MDVCVPALVLEYLNSVGPMHEQSDVISWKIYFLKSQQINTPLETRRHSPPSEVYSVPQIDILALVQFLFNWLPYSIDGLSVRVSSADNVTNVALVHWHRCLIYDRQACHLLMSTCS